MRSFRSRSSTATRHGGTVLTLTASTAARRTV
nr:MAG TPA: hypothetical protein [Bacteriophage sp.]DAI70599.1 MAG TPA: hypothetical protein [Bacteriophage sp.]